MRAFFCLSLVLLAITLTPAPGEISADEQKLVGVWEHEDEQQQIVARYSFRPNGSYTAELRRNGELQRKFEGLWRIEADMLVYTYTADSQGQIEPGVVEQDHLVRVTDDSYTIEAGDHLHRTYFRVKEKQ
jgi:hypothetical protein